MHKFFLSAVSTLLVLGAPLVASAQAALCDIASASERDALRQTESVARIASQLLKTAEAFDTLLKSRKWDDARPLGEQMTADEADNFGALRQTLASQNLASLYESKRERDIRVIARLSRLADEVSRYGFEPPKGEASEDRFLYGILFALREMIPIDPDKIAEQTVGKTCNLSTALHIASKKAVREALEVPGLAQANQALEALQVKYGDADVSKMSEPDRRKFLEIYAPIVRKSLEQMKLAADLQKLRSLDQVSKLMLKGWQQDQYEAPGDIKHAGSTWSSWVKDGRVSPRQHDMTRVINLINEKIPADIVNEKP